MAQAPIAIFTSINYDLVLLRELVKNDTARGHSDDIDRVAAQTGCGVLFEGALARAASPYQPVDIALRFKLLGVKAISACARSVTEGAAFARRCATRQGALLHLDIAPLRYRSFNSAMGRPRALSLRKVTHRLKPETDPSREKATRHMAIIMRDRRRWGANATRLVTQKRKMKAYAPNPKSPRTVYTYHPTESSSPNTASASAPSTNSMRQIVSGAQIEALPRTELLGRKCPLCARKSPRLGNRRTFGESAKADVLCDI